MLHAGAISNRLRSDDIKPRQAEAVDKLLGLSASGVALAEMGRTEQSQEMRKSPSALWTKGGTGPHSHAPFWPCEERRLPLSFGPSPPPSNDASIGLPFRFRIGGPMRVWIMADQRASLLETSSGAIVLCGSLSRPRRKRTCL